MSITILRGIPGSGKSHWVKQNVGPASPGMCVVRPVWPFDVAMGEPSCAIFSSDDYFCDPERTYTFDPAKLGAAHAMCLKRFTTAVQTAPDTFPMIVDNTGTSVGEVAPYAALASAFGHPIRILTLICDPVVAFKRNVHGVPFKTIFNMDRRLRDETALLPPYWRHDIELSQ